MDKTTHTLAEKYTQVYEAKAVNPWILEQDNTIFLQKTFGDFIVNSDLCVGSIHNGEWEVKPEITEEISKVVKYHEAFHLDYIAFALIDKAHLRTANAESRGYGYVVYIANNAKPGNRFAGHSYAAKKFMRASFDMFINKYVRALRRDIRLRKISLNKDNPGVAGDF